MLSRKERNVLKYKINSRAFPQIMNKQNITLNGTE